MTIPQGITFRQQPKIQEVFAVYLLSLLSITMYTNFRNLA